MDRPKVPPVYPRLIRGGSLLLHVQHTSISVIACNVDGHTRELGFTSRGNTPPLCMYARDTRVFPWHPGTRAVLFRRNPNPRARGSTPVAFSIRGLNNALSWWFRFV